MGESYKTRDIKSRLLKYYRFERGYNVGQEVNQMDIFAISKNRATSIEIEIKITKADLQNELHKDKHMLRPKKLTPNKYYLCVPNELKNDALEIITKLHKPEYGIMDCDTFAILKNATNIRKDNDYLYETLVRRLSSDCANKYEKMMQLEQANKSVTDYLKKLAVDGVTDKHYKKILREIYKSLFLQMPFEEILKVSKKVESNQILLKYKTYIVTIYGCRVKDNRYMGPTFYYYMSNYNLDYVIMNIIERIKEEQNVGKN